MNHTATVQQARGEYNAKGIHRNYATQVVSHWMLWANRRFSALTLRVLPTYTESATQHEWDLSGCRCRLCQIRTRPRT